MAEVIRYGAGGVPYKGKVGLQSSEAPAEAPAEEVPEEPKVTVAFEEDDTELTDAEVANKVEGN
jgi:hypothetical protein